MRATHSYIWTHNIEPFRVKVGLLYSSRWEGHNGCFEFPGEMRVVCSDGLDWEHVSVSFKDRCPTWEEMCIIKDLFWEEDEVVVQYHPDKKHYVNCHPFCLHLWKPIGMQLLVPPSELVGPKPKGN